MYQVTYLFIYFIASLGDIVRVRIIRIAIHTATAFPSLARFRVATVNLVANSWRRWRRHVCTRTRSVELKMIEGEYSDSKYYTNELAYIRMARGSKEDRMSTLLHFLNQGGFFFFINQDIIYWSRWHRRIGRGTRGEREQRGRGEWGRTWRQG